MSDAMEAVAPRLSRDRRERHLLLGGRAMGQDGAVIADRNGIDAVPAFATDVVDTTGCGDAFSAGFRRGLGSGRDTREAAVLWNGYMDGAVRSGERAAGEVLGEL